jgi:hypothetical protein
VKRTRRAPWLLVAASAMACHACNDRSRSGEPVPAAAPSVATPASTTSAPAATASATASTAPRGGDKGPPPRGIDGVFFRAARELPLADDQKAQVATLEEPLRNLDVVASDPMGALSLHLAAQVMSGRVNPDGLRRDEAAFDSAMNLVLDKEAKALAGLHDSLDAGQRKALVEGARARSREAEARDRDAGADDGGARRLRGMTRDLALDAGQQPQVAALLAKQPDPAAVRRTATRQTEAALDAFLADSFDAVTVLAPTVRSLHDAMEAQIAFTRQLAALLHGDQLHKLAQLIEKQTEEESKAKR